MQIDDIGGNVLQSKIEELGVSIHTNKSTTEIVSPDGKITKMTFADGSELQTDMIVFSAGIRPRDEIARECAIEVGNRGGIVINEYCQTSDSDIYAIGECALYQNRIYGLVAPGYTIATVAANALNNITNSTFDDADMSTKLKLLGVDVASFGDAFAKTSGAKEIAITDTISGVYKKLVVNEDGSRLLGVILVGDAASYGTLLQFVQNNIALPPHPENLLIPPREGTAVGIGVESLPDTAQICSCNNVSKGQICTAIAENNFTDIGSVKKCTKADTGCGVCVPLVTDLLKFEMKKAGIEVKSHLCEHFAYSRQEIYHLVRSHKIICFEELLAKHGQGKGCEICKPAVASILASTWNEYILNQPHVSLQDTNNAYLANIQKDGTYSVVPRVTGGELTLDKLISFRRNSQKIWSLY